MTVYCNVIHNSCDTCSTVGRKELFLFVVIATVNILHEESTFCCFVTSVHGNTREVKRRQCHRYRRPRPGTFLQLPVHFAIKC